MRNFAIKNVRLIIQSCILILLFSLSFAIMGLLFSLAQSLGFFESWDKLRPPPEKPLSLVKAYCSGVYIETISHNHYVCWLDSDSCWIEKEPIDEINPYLITDVPWTYKQPTKISNLVQLEKVFEAGADVFCYAFYALDKNGNVYAWEHTNSAMGIMFQTIIYIAFGMIIGFACAMLMVWFLRKKEKSVSTKRDP